MYISIMRYRNGKFGVSATEITKQGKTINKPDEIKNLKREFGANCSVYRVENKNGITHYWTLESMYLVTEALNRLPFPSQDNDEVE